MNISLLGDATNQSLLLLLLLLPSMVGRASVTCVRLSVRPYMLLLHQYFFTYPINHILVNKRVIALP